MRHGIIAAVLVCLAVPAFAQTDTTEIQSPINGHYYRLIPPTPPIDFWLNAQMIAESEGGNLATIRSQAENDWIISTFAPLTSNNNAFIGLNDRDVEGEFVWVSGEPVTYTNWNVGEPNNAGGTEHVTEVIFSTGLWNDNDATGAKPSIMERIVLEFRTQPSGGGFVFEGADVTLSAQVWGNVGPITYQWKKDGVDISGADGPTLLLPSVTDADNGTYLLEVSDTSKATITSNPISVQVVPPGSLPAVGALGLGVLLGAFGAGGMIAVRRRRS